MTWTAVSYNWSANCTGLYVFYGSYSHAQACFEFNKKFPGENLLALVAGDHAASSKTYPLLVPDLSKLKQEEENDCNA